MSNDISRNEDQNGNGSDATENQISQALGFDWRKLPRLDHGLISAHPITRPVSLRFALPTGRLIDLNSLYQFDIYAGWLCGYPNDPERQFMDAISIAKRHFPHHDVPPVVLEPLLHGGRVTVKDGFQAPWLRLPAVCTIAEFDSNKPARDEWEVYSSVLAIWFQDHYGLPTDARTLEQLRSLDWEKHAHDWTP